ncbi:Eukaryotic translation initiation factor 2-alpha kinase 3 [Halotydeus destructor]|nr:Eukaryotic translation initiation factor 2-alpha kinase 3 [Halotydeus destructor]
MFSEVQLHADILRHDSRKRLALGRVASKMTSSCLSSQGTQLTKPIEPVVSINNQAVAIEPYESRYLIDFEHVKQIGKGGFGVAFESLNKLDGGHYAVKRIILPLQEDKREKVLREVKALAKLNHPGIVRYYQSWTERPSPGWQEATDRQLYISAAKMDTDSHYSSSSTNGQPGQLAAPVAHSKALPANGTEQLSSKSNSSIIFSSSRGRSEPFMIYGNQNGGCCRNRDNGSSAASSSLSSCGTPFQSDNGTTSGQFSGDSSITSSSSSSSSSCCQSSSTSSSSNCSNEAKITGPLRMPPTGQSLSEGSDIVVFEPKAPLPLIPKAYLYIQMELCRESTLKEWIAKNNSGRNTKTVMAMFKKIVDAVDYIHGQELMHRDLKPSNIFLDQNGAIKIGDFGLATCCKMGQIVQTLASYRNNDHTKYIGTRLYMSPEQTKSATYTNKVDIFALGVILFEMLVPFKTEMERVTTLTAVRSRQFPENFETTYPVEHAIITDLLAQDPAARPTASSLKYSLRLYTPMYSRLEEYDDEELALTDIAAQVYAKMNPNTSRAAVLLRRTRFGSLYVKNFEYIQFLGSGSFGIVFGAKNRSDNRVYAIKRIQICYKTQALKTLKKQLDDIAKLNHPHIVKYYCAWTKRPPNDDHPDIGAVGVRSNNNDNEKVLRSLVKRRYKTKHSDFGTTTDSDDEDADSSETFYMYMQMELCRKSTLKDWLSETNCTREKEVFAKIFEMIVDAVNCVHLKGIIHRNLKPSNIFFSMEGTVKVGDFAFETTDSSQDGGFVHRMNHMSAFMGDSVYEAPERFTDSYTNKVDVYSLGMIYFELLVEIDTFFDRFGALSTVSLAARRGEKIPDDYIRMFRGQADLLQRMLSVDPKQRPTVAEIKKIVGAINNSAMPAKKVVDEGMKALLCRLCSNNYSF